MGPDNSYKVEMFSTSSSGFRRELLRQTKTFLTLGTTIQLHLSANEQSNLKSNIDCIWEKSQTAASTESSTFNKTGALEQLEQLEKSPSQFKHAVPDLINFLAQNNFGTFTATEHSSILRVSIDVTNAQCNGEECFQIIDSRETSPQNTFKYIDEDTVLYEHSLNEIFGYQTVLFYSCIWIVILLSKYFKPFCKHKHFSLAIQRAKTLLLRFVLLLLQIMSWN